MKLKILVAATLLAPLGLATAVQAETLANLKQLAVKSNGQPLLTAQSQPNLKPFSPAKGNFTVLMPGTPTEDTSDGYAYMVKTQSGVFVVAYKDFPGEIKQGNPDEYLDLVSQEFSRDGDRLLNKRKISLSGYPGREIESKTSEGIAGIIRIYLVNERLYTVIVLPSTAKDANNFLDSFRLTQ